MVLTFEAVDVAMYENTSDGACRFCLVGYHVIEVHVTSVEV